MPPVVFYCNGLFVNCTEAPKRVVCRIPEVEMSVLSFGCFLRAARVGPAKRLSLIRLIKKCDGQGVFMCVSKVIVKN